MKTLFLLCALCGSVYASDSGQPVEIQSIGWRFGLEDGRAGWSALHDLDPLRTTADGLLLRSTGGDPYAASPRFDIETAEYQYIRIRAKSYTGGQAQVFYALDDRHFNAADVATFALEGDGEWHVYHVVPGWPAGHRLRRIRFDPPDGITVLGAVSIIQRMVSGSVPVVPWYDFTAEAAVGPWMPDGGIEILDAQEGVMRARLSASRGQILSPVFEPPGEQRRWLVLRAGASGISRVLVGWRGTREKLFSPAHEVAIDFPADGKSHTVNYDLATTPEFSADAIQLSLTLVGSYSGGEIVFEQIGLDTVPHGPPHLLLVEAIFAASLLPEGTVIRPICTVRNVGGQRSPDARYHLTLIDLPAALTDTKEEMSLVPGLKPGEERQIPGPALRIPKVRGPRSLSVGVQLREESAVVGSATAEGFPTRTITAMPGERPGEGTIQLTQDSHGLVVANHWIRLRFPRNPFGYGVVMVDCYTDQGASQMGVLPSFGLLQTGEEKHPTTLFCQEVTYRTPRQPGGKIIRFVGHYVDEATRNWSQLTEFHLPVDTPWVRAQTTLVCDQDAAVAWFEFPRYLAGDGGFGRRRDLGLLPGLEYLLPNEPSSAKSFVEEPFNRRLTPHPNKITIPLAAVQYDGLWTGLIWDPGQRWDGVYDRPTVIFSSPDRTGVTPGHRLGLAVPTVPEWTNENDLQSFRPYQLPAREALSLEAVLFCVQGDDVDALLSLWRDVTGAFPDPPAVPGTWEDAVWAAQVGFVESMWDPETKGWHRALHDPWGPTYVENVYLQLSWSLTLGLVPDEWIEDMIRILREAREERIRSAGLSGLGVHVAFHEGGVLDILRANRRRLRRMAQRQHADGSFPFEPDEQHAVFGRSGDSSSGCTAAKAHQIWFWATMLGDPILREAGLKTLDYFSTQKRPEGAQTWELPLHVPDVLASAHIIRCYVAAYDSCGESSFLKAAELWAYRALPFIYLWNPEDRPIMRYGSIPVFGASWFTGAWFGRIVQWNGLVLADALLELAERLPGSQWRKVAEGIAACGAQQQRPLQHDRSPYRDAIPNCGHRGMYPDAYSAVAGTDAYHWCLSGDLLAATIQKIIGGHPFIKRTVVRRESETLLIHTVAEVSAAEWDGEVLSADLKFLPGLTYRVLIVGLDRAPQSVEVGGRQVPHLSSEPLIEEGSIWEDELGVLLLTVRAREDVERLRVER